MTPQQIEALKLALETLECWQRNEDCNEPMSKILEAIKEALAQTEQNQFNPDWDTQAVLVEEQQRMAKRILELEALLERQTARIVDLQTHIENLEGEE